jgi:hypothetical protein
MAIRFSRSAVRHGIRHDRSRYVVEHGAFPLYSDDPEREMHRDDYARVMRCHGR